MGRVDRKTRFFLADMLVGFLRGDYRRVAEVHFEAGYVPADQSLDDFMQACRAIGQPLLGKPLNQISLGRLLAQLFRTTETFRMETQPQLLMLQKTMLVAEGMGRQLDPSVNMWELAQPLIEDWMVENRGPAARLVHLVQQTAAILERLPILLEQLEAAAAKPKEDKGVSGGASPPRAVSVRLRHWLIGGFAFGLALALGLTLGDWLARHLPV